MNETKTDNAYPLEGNTDDRRLKSMRAEDTECGSRKLCAPWRETWLGGARERGTHLQRPRRTPWCRPRRKA